MLLNATHHKNDDDDDDAMIVQGVCMQKATKMQNVCKYNDHSGKLKYGISCKNENISYFNISVPFSGNLQTFFFFLSFFWNIWRDNAVVTR